MPYAWLQDLPIDQSVYQRIRTALGSEVPPGLIVHLVTPSPTGSGLRYIDVWESKSDFDRAMDEVIHPAVFSVFKEMGFAPMAEPPRTDLSVIEFRTATS